MAEKKTRKTISRRQFLKDAAVLGGAVVGGGVLVPPTAVPARQTPGVVTKEVQVTLKKAIGHVSHNSDICTGCNSCEVLCSLRQEGLASPALARIQISTDYSGGWKNKAITCRQCDAPNCLAVCPTGALSIDAKTGARVIDAAKCIGCQLCIKACPQYPNSPIQFKSDKKVSFKCDLCGGDPLCVKYCPEGALSLVTGGA
jgi:Fe-S-cluster-containing hydrogenase component 2